MSTDQLPASAHAPDATGDATTSAVASTSTTRRGRLEFLDVLRGIAALTVVLQHFVEAVSVSYWRWAVEAFRPGVFGVELFFLVSGFIIPASIERYHSLRKFWIGRFFRLFPLYWFLAAAALVLHHFFRRYELPAGFAGDPFGTVLANLTMAHDFLQYDRILVVTWTLSYELVFYLLISLLFIGGLNTRSLHLSLLTTASIVMVGLFIPGSILENLPRPFTLHELSLAKPLQFVVMATLIVAVLTYSRARTTGHRAAAVALSLLTIPLLFNQPRDLWYSLSLFAMMFAGTVFYRMATGTVSPSRGWAVVGFTAAVILVTQRTWIAPHVGDFGARITPAPEMRTFVAASALFVVFFFLRARRFPKVFTWLGTVSYSIYLIHGIVQRAVPRMPDAFGIPGAVTSVVLWTAISLGLSALTFRYVEVPFQNLGREVIRHIGQGRWPVRQILRRTLWAAWIPMTREPDLTV